MPDPTDSEPDGIPDYFELFHLGTLAHDGSYVATPGGLTLAEAYAAGTNPNSLDSDDDGWNDSQELNWGWSVNYDQSRDDSHYGSYGDVDGDGIPNSVEATLGSDPSIADGAKPTLQLKNAATTLHLIEGEDYRLYFESYDADGSEIQQLDVSLDGNQLWTCNTRS